MWLSGVVVSAIISRDRVKLLKCGWIYFVYKAVEMGA